MKFTSHGVCPVCRRLIPVDFSGKIRYDLYMISMKDAIAAALGDFVEQHTGIRPHPKPSKRAHLASSDFLRGDADETAKLLSAHAGECTLFGAPLIRKIEAENGWLLFFGSRSVTPTRKHRTIRSFWTDSTRSCSRRRTANGGFYPRRGILTEPRALRWNSA